MLCMAEELLAGEAVMIMGLECHNKRWKGLSYKSNRETEGKDKEKKKI